MYFYYTYVILFATGHYYYGVRQSEVEPFSDNYWGSPRTNKHFWEEVIHCKEILDQYPSYQEARSAESKLIGDLYKTDPLCLNAHNNGNFYRSGPAKEETKKKISEKAKGRIPSDQARKNMSCAQRGRKASKETRSKISRALKGKPKSESHKKNLSIANTGKQLSQKTLDKMSQSLIGKVPWNKGVTGYSTKKKGRHYPHTQGRKASDEARRKMSIARKGKPTKTKEFLPGVKESIVRMIADGVSKAEVTRITGVSSYRINKLLANLYG